MIVDIFSFNGELDVLEIRLNVLNDVVDQFIICESEYTFTGIKKPLYFKENQERFAKFLPKIKHYIMASDDFILARDANHSPGVPQDLHWWRREYTQKESMRYALTHLQDDDLVFIGDADEIWNPKYFPLHERCKLEATVYSYYLNNKSSEWWEGTSVMPYKLIKTDTLDNLRAHDSLTPVRRALTFPNGGWHFTNMGGAEFVKRKLASYSHQEFNHTAILDSIDKQIAQNRDFIGRDFTFTIDETGLPEYVLQNKDKYAHIWKQSGG